MRDRSATITNGPYADTIVFICKLDEGDDPKERKVLTFVLDRGTPGLTQSKPLRKMGLHSSATGELFLDDVRVEPGMSGSPGRTARTYGLGHLSYVRPCARPYRMKITASKLRENIYKLLDQVLETGTPVEIERRGRKLRIVPGDDPPRSKLDRLEPRPHAIVGDPEDLVHLDWSTEWKP